MGKNDKVSILIVGLAILFFGGIITTTLLDEADNSFATQLLSIGLSAAGILSLVGLIVFILKR